MRSLTGAYVLYSMKKKLILASQSAIRQEVLKSVGLEFEVQPSGFDEKQEKGEKPENYVMRNAYGKGLMVAQSQEDALVLSADTLAVFSREVFEKPKDEQDARRMLRVFSGERHEVLTAFCLFDVIKGQVNLVTKEIHSAGVSFRYLSEKEISAYLVAFPRFSRVAGGYSLQMGAPSLGFVEKVDGHFMTVLGLPISSILRCLFEQNFCYPQVS